MREAFGSTLFMVNVSLWKKLFIPLFVSHCVQLPGVCWACKWALRKVKKALTSNNLTAEVKYGWQKAWSGGRGAAAGRLCLWLTLSFCQVVKQKLLSVCDQIGLLKSLCRKFVKAHLGELIEEVTTSDDVTTICVNAKACK